MSIKPIPFSTPIVRAILDGRKTMTRRVVKPQPEYRTDYLGGWAYKTRKSTTAIRSINEGVYPDATPYRAGDVLWVRETWRCDECNPECAGNTNEDECPFNHVGNICYQYKAQYSDPIPKNIDWRPSIFMPREAARIFLRVTDVRVERLQDITCEDIYSEGAPFGEHEYNFETFWDSINAKRGYGWDTNPWVWVYTFERVEKPDSTRAVAKYATHGEFIPDKEVE